MAKYVFAGVGVSTANDPNKAGKEAVDKAMEDMRRHHDKSPVFGLVFCSGGKYGKDDKTIQKLVDSVHSAFGGVQWAGCTTAGEISPVGATHGSVVVMVFGGDYLRFGIGIGDRVFEQPKKAGAKAVEDAFKSLKLDVHVDAYMQYMRFRKHTTKEIIKMIPYSLIVLGKGPERGVLPGIPKIPDLEEVMDGIIETCGTQIPIVGGGSFDDWELKRNYHFVNGKVYKDAVVVVAILSNLFFSTGVSHGYHPTGKVLMVNRSKRSGGSTMVSEMNDKKALDVYAEITGVPKEDIKKDPIKFGALHPLGVFDIDGEAWIRGFGATFMNDLIFSNKIEKNTPLQVMEGTENEIFDAYKDAADRALKQIGKKKLAAAIIFSCACRNKYMGEKIGKEIEIFKKAFPDTPFIGFYTFGEFGGVLGKRTGFHTQSVSILLITDELMA